MITVTDTLGTPSLQQQLDTGKRIYVPQGRLIIDRPLFVDVDGTSLEGDGESTEIYNTQSGGCLILGIKRKPLSADHYPLGGGFRTCGDSRIVFQSSPFSKLSPQMTIQCQVTANGGWGNNQTHLFGSMYNGEPGPWYCMVVDGGTKLAFMFKTADGVVHTATAPISGTSIQVNIHLDLAAGFIQFGNQGLVVSTMTCNPPLLPNSAWSDIDTKLFQIGAVGDGLMSAPEHDLTFQQLSLPWISLVDNPGLPFNDKPPQPPWVHAYGTEGHFCGYFVGALTNGDTIANNKVRDIKLTASKNYGQGVGIGLCYDVSLERCHIGSGAQNVGSINAGSSYLIRLRDCVLDYAADCSLYAYYATVSALGLSLKYFGNSAAVFKGCGAQLTDCITTDSPTCRYVYKMLDNRGSGGEYSFRGGFSDFEGKPSPGTTPYAYFYCERDPNTPITELIVSGMRLGGRLGGPAYVILKDSPLGGPMTPCYARVPIWMSVQADPCWKVSQLGI